MVRKKRTLVREPVQVYLDRADRSLLDELMARTGLPTSPPGTTSCSMGRRPVADRGFADTSGLLALAHRRDRHHARASAFIRRFQSQGGRPMLTPLVLAELQGLLLLRHGPDQANPEAGRATRAFSYDRHFEAAGFQLLG